MLLVEITRNSTNYKPLSQEGHTNPKRGKVKRTRVIGKSQLFTRHREWLNSDFHALGVLRVLEKQNN